jgi:hypothetical protein
MVPIARSSCSNGTLTIDRVPSWREIAAPTGKSSIDA